MEAVVTCSKSCQRLLKNGLVDSKMQALPTIFHQPNIRMWYNRRYMRPLSLQKHCLLLPQFYIHFSCATETPRSVVGSPTLQVFSDIFVGRAQPSSRRLLDITLLNIFKSVCGTLKEGTNKSLTGSLTVNEWSASYGAPIFGMIWNYCDESWRLQCVSMACLKLRQFSKTITQLFAMMEEVFVRDQNSWVG